MTNSDDEGDSCVLLGTPLVDLMPEDAKFSVKAKRQEEQIVTDEKGRQRFHGAFTGGFSAGYFNSVGSKEGWTPATFKSTRSEKADKKSYQRPEDFMDEEDFGDHGIAPKTLKVKTNYKDEIKTASLSSQNYLANSFDDLIKPVRNTIGVKMARKMGWREGQGVGPRIKRKLRKLKTKIYHEPGRKLYGVTLPPESDESENDDDFDDEYLVSQFDVNEFQFEIKEDLFGLGYKRLQVNDLFSANNSKMVQESPAASLLFPAIEQKPKAVAGGMRGQAFGGGDDDDEDEVDVYRQDTMDSYNFDLDGKGQKEAKKLLNKTYGFGAFEDDVMILKKFFQSDKKQQPAKVFKGPQVPTDFNLKHKLTSTTSDMNLYLKTASDRADILSEEGLRPESVFDLISSEDKKFLDQVKLKHGLIKEETAPPIDLKRLNQEDRSKRYELFISYMKQSQKDPYSLIDTTNLTEWEKEKEKDEFLFTYQQQMKQIEQAKQMTSKFVSTKVLNAQNEEVDLPKSVESSKPEEEEIDSKLIDVHKAARLKKYGQSTRTEYEWRPHPTVCKRFNVPNPYPISAHDQKYGTVGNESKKGNNSDRFSMLNLMTASTRFDKEKSKNLFDELNTDAAKINLIGPSHTKIVKLPEAETGKASIEFESKSVQRDSSKKSEFSIIMDKTPILPNKPEAKLDKETNISNIYLQERPVEIDIFKAIFEDEDEEEEEKPKNEDIELVESEEEPEIKQPEPKATSIIPSTISDINIKDVRRYLEPTKEEVEESDRKDDDSENKRIIFKKPGESSKKSSEVETFSKLVKSLAKATESKKNSSTSSSSSSDSDIEIVYEEVSSSKKDSDKKHKKSKKKKKKQHKKKSKKSKD